MRSMTSLYITIRMMVLMMIALMTTMICHAVLSYVMLC